MRAAGHDTRVVLGELTHRTTGLADDAGTLQYRFQWRAQNAPGTVTFYAAGVLGKADRNPATDGVVRTRVRIEVTEPTAQGAGGNQN